MQQKEKGDLNYTIILNIYEYLFPVKSARTNEANYPLSVTQPAVVSTAFKHTYFEKPELLCQSTEAHPANRPFTVCIFALDCLKK